MVNLLRWDFFLANTICTLQYLRVIINDIIIQSIVIWIGEKKTNKKEINKSVLKDIRVSHNGERTILSVS